MSPQPTVSTEEWTRQYVHEVKVMVVLERRANATNIEEVIFGKEGACHILRHPRCMKRVDEQMSCLPMK
jgi:hypothetical protein